MFKHRNWFIYANENLRNLTNREVYDTVFAYLHLTKITLKRVGTNTVPWSTTSNIFV